jgi:hypothetical protein
MQTCIEGCIRIAPDAGWDLDIQKKVVTPAVSQRDLGERDRGAAKGNMIDENDQMPHPIE